jgi:hypothetical protein
MWGGLSVRAELSAPQWRACDKRQGGTGSPAQAESLPHKSNLSNRENLPGEAQLSGKGRLACAGLGAGTGIPNRTNARSNRRCAW